MNDNATINIYAPNPQRAASWLSIAVTYAPTKISFVVIPALFALYSCRQQATTTTPPPPATPTAQAAKPLESPATSPQTNLPRSGTDPWFPGARLPSPPGESVHPKPSTPSPQQQSRPDTSDPWRDWEPGRPKPAQLRLPYHYAPSDRIRIWACLVRRGPTYCGAHTVPYQHVPELWIGLHIGIRSKPWHFVCLPPPIYGKPGKRTVALCPHERPNHCLAIDRPDLLAMCPA